MSADHRFHDPAETMLKVLQRLAAGWEELSPAARDEIRVEVERFLASVDPAAGFGDRAMAAIQQFLLAIEDNDETLPLVQEVLDAVRTDDLIIKGVSPEAVQELLAATFSIPGVRLPLPQAIPPSEPAPAAETVVDLHSRIDFPTEVSIFDELVPLVVQLTPDDLQGAIGGGVTPVGFRDINQPEQLLVSLSAEGFDERTGDSTRSILVYADKDSQPAVFLLTPRSPPGRKRIVVDFYHRNRPVGAATFETNVLDRPPVDRQTRVAIDPLLAEPAPAKLSPAIPVAPVALPPSGVDDVNVTLIQPIVGLCQVVPEPVDLELRVTLGASRRRLSFMLHSPNRSVGYHWQSAGSVDLAEAPRLFLALKFAYLNRLARSSREQRTPEEDLAYREELTRIGRNLYHDLFSAELKQAYRRIRELRQAGKIESLLITSDEPWIPWELVKPYESDGRSGEELFDDDFLCAQFRLSRWLAGRGVPEAVRVRAAQLVAPDSNLSYVQQEKEYFDRLPDKHPDLIVNPPINTARRVLETLAAAHTQLYHFASHGNFNVDDPNESMLLLEDAAFAPSQVIGPQRVGVTRSRPLVFLNACHSGQVGFSLTGLGGWAERFVNAGASAFIGAVWEVNDKLAAEFAIHFYEALWGGQPLGEAFHKARMHVRQLDEANPTWLAYTLYADPNGRAELGQAPLG